MAQSGWRLLLEDTYLSLWENGEIKYYTLCIFHEVYVLSAFRQAPRRYVHNTVWCNCRFPCDVGTWHFTTF